MDGDMDDNGESFKLLIDEEREDLREDGRAADVCCVGVDETFRRERMRVSGNDKTDGRYVKLLHFSSSELTIWADWVRAGEG